jgi:anti-sigma regulatory factor (Ser/Thr protein kinase)
VIRTKPDSPKDVHDSITLLPEPRSAGEARHFVADSLRDVVSADVSEIAVLLTSELVTNVIVHARTPMRLDVDTEPPHGGVRVAIADDVPRPPVRRSMNDGRLTGRGMHLVESLAREWGVEPTARGKRVWFELS